MNIKFSIPKNVKIILDTLHKNNYEAYIVGGCVRDFLLGNTPVDYDITTNCRPNEIKKIFKKTVDTGIKHGTVTVLLKNSLGKYDTFEVTTYRIDGEYKDCRHPDNVFFVSNLKDDLYRRDFTINAFAYNEEEGLIDLFDGKKDLNNKLIRAVGIAKDRINEDALRMLRAIRFSAKLTFDIDYEVIFAIKTLAKNLSNVSKERIQIELNKILMSDNPCYINKIFDLGLQPYICHNFDKLEKKQIIKSNKLYVLYASFFYNYEDLAYGILKELKFDNDTIKKCILLLTNKQHLFEISKTFDIIKIKELISKITYEGIYDLIYLCTFEEQKDFSKVLKLIESYEKEKCPIFIKDLAINGNDIKDIGFKGDEIGYILNKLLYIVHKNRSYNNRSKLLSIVTFVYKNIGRG